MPIIHNPRTTASSTSRIDRDVLQESQALLGQVRANLQNDDFEGALYLTSQVVHPLVRSQAIYAIFPQLVVKRPNETVALIAQIEDREIKLNCQNYACYKLNQLGLKHLIQQVSDSSESPEIKRLAARLLK